ncbi:MAG: hypothetical protein K9J37_03975 [Saprospiraceae bacterium]|nr:hypothetical protein [Saprospiraceae bacterium]MCF8249043.1 hypothetical protein [Saprospiraceae bacterium]MCF8282668.1 hypothetical protein [Bacteroidales bacterium]MCF8311065.1 hypothetical protein [Saprospiraceae bacterium]
MPFSAILIDDERDCLDLLNWQLATYCPEIKILAACNSPKEGLEAIAPMLGIEQMRFKNKFEYRIEVDKKIDTHFFRLPPLILQPYVENAIWHGLLHKTGDNGRLTVHLKAVPGGFQCIFEDNGIGREKSKALKSLSFKKRKSYGMQISRERIALLSKQYFQTATLDIEDLKDENGQATGTRVTATLCP